MADNMPKYQFRKRRKSEEKHCDTCRCHWHRKRKALPRFRTRPTVRLDADENWEPKIGSFGGEYPCGIALELHEAHIHHIKPRSPSRWDNDFNQVTLCADHHELYKKKVQWSGRKSA